MSANDVLEALNSWKRNQFSYGTTDCCQLAGHVAKKLTGTDYLERFDYSSESEAMKIIDAHGGLRETVTSVLGQPTIDIEDGFPVLCEVNGLELLGVKLRDSAVCLTKKGLAQIRPEFIKCGWKI
jgi:hypothetical protein